MSKILGYQIRQELIARHNVERDKRVADRIKSILLYDEGWSAPVIAQVLFRHEDSVRRYINDYLKKAKIAPEHKGSEQTLTPQESHTLSDNLEAHIYTKIKDIQAYVRTTFGKQLSISALHNWLKVHGFSYKKPKLVPRNVDFVAQAEFIAHYHEVLNEASIEGDPVIHIDAVHPSQQTRPSYGWIKKGQDKALETTGGRKRVNLMGGTNLEDVSVFRQEYETINGQAAVSFLKHVENQYPDVKKIHVICDRAGYYTCQEVKEFLISSRIKVHYLPPRSPNLNPIERLWKIMHEYVSNNRTYLTFQDFKKSLDLFFDDTIHHIRDVLASRLTDNFQQLPPAK